MSKARTSTLVSLLAAACLSPGIVLAESDWHFIGGEVGYAAFPDHAQNIKTRADVLRELEQAKADGSHYYLQRAMPVPSRGAGPGKTRQQVLDELVNISPAERARMNRIYYGG
ncbi:DUF4148 domain-containing protein [Thauera linaloolentis]|uniref:DUF4148 domain-containing protein n=1 Tax=Thauera linaloolentis (strain DSM 12138 / JCM 21573 / CCUG 41526 / CIP 105981 / IAM 15112 / NBRC 102519 / 47Lol) TaxID=1123367 RepID=N6Z0I9_THAL4|nr:DUF4148 domain-containing protein [Thauera linaloolentis]ENO87888.1 hypothetical protein C666_09975 [Thauera linaloolentis 47Lol = DSM 12138]MCM8567578.1 DUF4148 domain-containing protein [Thauera linaloolentis]